MVSFTPFLSSGARQAFNPPEACGRSQSCMYEDQYAQCLAEAEGCQQAPITWGILSSVSGCGSVCKR